MDIKASELVRHKFSSTNGTSLKISKSCDDINPLYLVINNPSNDFKLNKINIDIIHENNNQTVNLLTIDCDVFENLFYNFKQIIDNKIIFRLPLRELNIVDIKIVIMKNHNMHFNLEKNGSYENAELLSYDSYYKNQSELFDKTFITEIRQYSEQIINHTGGKMRFAIDKKHRAKWNGFMVYGCNIDNIISISLLLENYCRQKYEDITLKLLCKKYSNNCFYFPLTQSNDFLNALPTLCAHNINKIDIEINSSPFNGKICFFYSAKIEINEQTTKISKDL